MYVNIKMSEHSLLVNCRPFHAESSLGWFVSFTLGGRLRQDYFPRVCRHAVSASYRTCWRSWFVFVRVNWITGSHRVTQAVHATCRLHPRYTPERESWIKLVFSVQTRETSSAEGRGCDRRFCATLERCPTKSLWRLFHQPCFSQTSCQRAAKKAKLQSNCCWNQTETSSLLPKLSELPTQSASYARYNVVYWWSLVPYVWLHEFTEFQDTNCQKSLRYSQSEIAGVLCAISGQMFYFSKELLTPKFIGIFSQVYGRTRRCGTL